MSRYRKGRKTLKWLGDSLSILRSWTKRVTWQMGSELLIVQEGGVPSDWKPMVSIGWEVKEIRAHSEDGQYRVIYIAKFAEAVYVLHAFQKKTQKTSKHDLEVATRRFKELEQRRRELGL